MLTAAQRRELIDRIAALPAQVEALVRGLTLEQLTTPYLDGEWTVAQNVHHLADSHMNSVIRLKLALTEDRPTFKPYDQERWAELADMRRNPIEDSLAILHGLHRRWVSLFESLSEEQWQRCGIHPEVGIMSAEDILIAYAKHGEDHLDQITRTLAAGRG